MRSIRKLETRHVNLKPTERSEGGFKFTCRVSNFRIDRYRHSLTDLYTGSFVSLYMYKKTQCSVQTAIIMTAASVSLRRSCSLIIVFSRDMTFDQTISCTKRENWVSDVFVSTCFG